MSSNGGGEPIGELSSAINDAFGSFDSMKEEFTKAAMTRFGSGWAWLNVSNNGTLSISATPNQDSPVLDGQLPILGLDVWEHAYYLKYQNLRPSYVSDFISFVNWNKVNELYASAKG